MPICKCLSKAAEVASLWLAGTAINLKSPPIKRKTKCWRNLPADMKQIEEQLELKKKKSYMSMKCSLEYWRTLIPNKIALQPLLSVGNLHFKVSYKIQTWCLGSQTLKRKSLASMSCQSFDLLKKSDFDLWTVNFRNFCIKHYIVELAISLGLCPGQRWAFIVVKCAAASKAEYGPSVTAKLRIIHTSSRFRFVILFR